MDPSPIHQTAALVAKDFELEAGVDDFITEEQLLEVLSHRVAYLIEHRLEYLLSLMYRLDIDERKINAALHPGSAEPAHIAVARLIIERQKQRLSTKRQYRSSLGDAGDMEGLEL